MSRRACHLTMVDKNSLCKWNNLVDRVGKFLQHFVQSVPAEPAVRRVARIVDEVGDRLPNFPMRPHLLKFLPAVLALSACVSNEYMGISLRSGAAEPELQELVRRAQAGENVAQLELGIRFEEGRGVDRDIAKARDMYRLAASDSGGPVWVYVPSVGNGTKGRVMQVDGGPKISGLAEAKARLDLLARIPEEN